MAVFDHEMEALAVMKWQKKLCRARENERAKREREREREREGNEEEEEAGSRFNDLSFFYPQIFRR